MTNRENGNRLSFGATVWADMECFAELKGARLASVGGFLDVLMFPGVLAVLLFRLSALCHHAGLRPFSRLLYILNLMLFGVDIAPGAEVGPGLALPHPVGVAIAPGARLGRKVRLFQGVSVGGVSYEERSRDGFPTVGNECWIFASSLVLGPVTIGDHALISAGAIVTRPVPPGGVMVGNPARLVRYRDGFQPVASAPVARRQAEPVGLRPSVSEA